MEDLDTLRKRLVYQSHHRGMRELDFLLGRFADKHLPSMTHAELKEFEALLACSEDELYGLFFEKGETSGNLFQPLIVAIEGEEKPSL